MTAAVLRVAVLALAASAAAPAQVNTERLRRAAGAPLAVSLDAAAAYATGNAEYLRLGLGGRVDVRLGQGLAFVVGRADLSRADGRAFLDRQFAHARYAHPVAPRLFAEAFGQVERNRQQRLRSRTLAGAGLRYQLADRDSLGLALGLTPMLEHERLDAELGEAPGTVVRVSSYGAVRWLVGPSASLTATAYLQPRADRPGDLRVLGQAGVEVGLTRSLRLSVQATVRHDSRPPGGVEATDVSVENGLVFVLR